MAIFIFAKKFLLFVSVQTTWKFSKKEIKFRKHFANSASFVTTQQNYNDTHYIQDFGKYLFTANFRKIFTTKNLVKFQINLLKVLSLRNSKNKFLDHPTCNVQQMVIPLSCFS